ncbi:MAG TPA: BMP family ABC transporter substrate-binding protein, partial [Delftia acidovorans]|nr:BMP family ABC transporter substrate-binding protein [Delftia acidovorans]
AAAGTAPATAPRSASAAPAPAAKLPAARQTVAAKGNDDGDWTSF